MLLPGILCNHQCPDELRLGELTSNSWHFGIKLGIAVLINAIAVFCLIMKLASKFWLYRLEKKQADYLQSLDEELEVTDSATLPVMTTNCLIIYAVNILYCGRFSGEFHGTVGSEHFMEC